MSDLLTAGVRKGGIIRLESQDKRFCIQIIGTGYDLLCECGETVNAQERHLWQITWQGCIHNTRHHVSVMCSDCMHKHVPIVCDACGSSRPAKEFDFMRRRIGRHGERRDEYIPVRKCTHCKNRTLYGLMYDGS